MRFFLCNCLTTWNQQIKYISKNVFVYTAPKYIIRIISFWLLLVVFFLVLNSSLLFIVSFLILNSFVFSLLTIELFFICLFVHQQLYMVANESADIYAWAMQCMEILSFLHTTPTHSIYLMFEHFFLLHHQIFTEWNETFNICIVCRSKVKFFFAYKKMKTKRCKALKFRTNMTQWNKNKTHTENNTLVWSYSKRGKKSTKHYAIAF